jgi:transcriptional regulator NrdR family protein
MKPGLHCPRCQSTQLRTIDTRKTDNTIRRKRECHRCGEKFYTTESVQGGKSEVPA